MDLASLTISNESSSVATTTTRLRALEQQSQKTEKATDSLSGGLSRMDREYLKLMSSMEKELRAIREVQQAHLGLARSHVEGAAAASREAQAVEKASAAHGRYGSSSGRAAQAARSLGSAALTGGAGMESAALSMGQLALAGGPAGIAIGVATGAIVALGAAAEMHQGALRETAGLLEGVGRASGMTAKQVDDVAKSAASAGGISVGAARETANEYLKLGGISSEVMPGLIALQKDFAVATGVDAATAAKELGRAFKDPSKGAEELNEKFLFLDATEVRNIQTLAEHGRLTEAQIQLLRDLQPEIGGTAESLGGLSYALDQVADHAKNAWNWLGEAVTKAQLMVQLGPKLAGALEKRAEFEARLNGANAKANQASTSADSIADQYDKQGAAVRRLTADLAKLQDGIVVERSKGNTAQVERLSAAYRTAYFEWTKALRGSEEAAAKAEPKVRGHARAVDTGARAARTAAADEKRFAAELERANNYFLSRAERQSQTIEQNLSVIRRAFYDGKASVEDYTRALQQAANMQEVLSTKPAINVSDLTTDLPGVADLRWASPAGMAEQEDRVREMWERGVGDGVRAAFDGNLLSYLRDTIKNALASSLTQTITNAITGARGSGGATGGGGMLGGLSSMLGGGGGGGGFLSGLGGMFGFGGGGAAAGHTMTAAIAGSGPIAGSGVLAGISGGAAGAGGLSGMMGGLGAAFMSNPVGWIAGGVAIIGGLVGLLGGDKAKKAEARRKALEEQEKMLSEAREIAEDGVRRLKEAEEQRFGLLQRLYAAQKNDAELQRITRAREMEGMDERNKALAEYTYAFEDWRASVDSAQAALQAAYDQQAGAIQDNISALESWIESLRDFYKELQTGDLAMNAPGAQYSKTRAVYGSTFDLALSGNQPARDGYTDAASEFLAASKANSRTMLDYQRDLAGVKANTKLLEQVAGVQLTVEQQQLGALNAMVAGILNVNQSLLSVAQALADYRSAMAAKPADRPDLTAEDPWREGGAMWNQLRAQGQADLAAGAWGDPNKNNGGSAIDMVLGNLRSDPAQVRAWYEQAKAAGSLLYVDAYLGLQAGTFAGFARNLGLPVFNTGGSFMVGGNAGIDQNVLSLNGRPAARVSQGETVKVTSKGDPGSAAVVAAIERLNERMGKIEKNTEQQKNLLNQVYEGGAVTQRTLVNAVSG